MAPAPLEIGGLGGERLSDARPVDTLMRALLYVAQQAGRPVSEPDVRRLAGLPDADLDETAFLTVAARLGLQAAVVDLGRGRLEDLPTPFAVSGRLQPACVVLEQRAGLWTVLDVVKGRARRLSADQVRALGEHALVLRDPPVPEAPRRWFVPFWKRVRPVIVKLAATSFLINILGLATPLFMMLVLNRVIGHGTAQSVASLMTALAIGMLLAYALDFGLRVARGWLSARTGARLDMLLSAEVGGAGQTGRHRVTLGEDVLEHGRPESVDVAELVLHGAPGRTRFTRHGARTDGVGSARGQAAQRRPEQVLAGLESALVEAGALGAQRRRGGGHGVGVLSSARGARRAGR